MKKSIGSLLLLSGVVVAALAAGESQRVSRSAPIDSALVGQVLHGEVRTHYETEFPEVFVYQDRILEAGHAVLQDDLEWLESLQIEEVLVLRRISEEETVPVGTGSLGRVLAQPIVLKAEADEIQKGRKITAAFAQRLREAELLTVDVSTERRSESGRVEMELVTWPLGPQAEVPVGLTLIGSTLREVLSIPVQLKTSSYVDESLLARLEASEVSEISVKIPKSWQFEEWADRYRFLLGIVLTALGVILRRAKPDSAALEQKETELAELAEQLVRLEGEVERWVRSAADLDAPALHQAISPLLSGPVYLIAEGRYAIRVAHGNRVFASVMDAFARGERKLNRAWSAAVDGHAVESRASLTAALPALREAREALPGTQPPTPVGFEHEGEDNPLPPDVPIASAEGHWSDDES
jgi:hypothetical protein